MTRWLAALALLAPAPAWAASGDVGCIAARLGPAALQRIGDGVVRAVDGAGDPARALDEDRATLIAARDACRAAARWSSDAVRAATSYMQAEATRIGAEAALRRDRVDPAALAGAYRGLAAADRRSFLDALSPAALAAVDAASSQPPVRRHVLLYFAALAGLELYPAEFAGA